MAAWLSCLGLEITQDVLRCHFLGLTFAKSAGIAVTGPQSSWAPVLHVAGPGFEMHLDRLPNPDDMDAQAHQGCDEIVNSDI